MKPISQEHGDSIVAAVEAGADFLDLTTPDWWEWVNPLKIRVGGTLPPTVVGPAGDCTDSIVRYLYSGPLDDEEASAFVLEHGFMAFSRREAELLDQCWAFMVLQRKARAGAWG